jgi:hypothetical protein
MYPKSRSDAGKLVPADQELRKFIESGGRPEAQTYFDEIIHKATGPKQPVVKLDKTSERQSPDKNNEKRTR